jgi:hypothetical protein
MTILDNHTYIFEFTNNTTGKVETDKATGYDLKNSKGLVNLAMITAAEANVYAYFKNHKNEEIRVELVNSYS